MDCPHSNTRPGRTNDGYPYVGFSEARTSETVDVDLSTVPSYTITERGFTRSATRKRATSNRGGDHS